MKVDTELAQWGEPPVSAAEEALMNVLDLVLEKRARGEVIRPEDLLTESPELGLQGSALLKAVACIEDLVVNLIQNSTIEEPSLTPVGASLRPWLSTASPPTIEKASLSPAGSATEVRDGALPDAVEGFPAQLPREYRVRTFLGKGSFSRVWLADDLGLDMPVALKTLHFHVAGHEREVALSALRTEARIIARLQHPNIVRVYCLFQAADEHYLVLQYVDGGSLQARLEEEGPLAWQLAARYIADVGEALLHVHEQGIVHRDVKLANILWDRRRDEALLTDFGLASHLSDSGQVAGTPLYMAPEAFTGKSSPACDVYGLAASLFTLMTGRVPFPAKTRTEILSRINQGLPDFEPLFDGVPERLERVIRSGLAAAPARRPDLRAFVADLRGSLNRLLADSLLQPTAKMDRVAGVDLRLTVARWESGNYVPVAETHSQNRGTTRNMTKVPPQPECVGLRTGDRVRLEVNADRDGFVAVFNVGPSGQLNLLHPDPASATSNATALAANRPLFVTDIAMTSPAGNERVFAIWSLTPLPLEKAVELTRGGTDDLSPSYRATRNMERVQASVCQLRREDWHAVVLELDHLASDLKVPEVI